MKDIFQNPIIKETVEDVDQRYRVSKADEDFALNYIRRKLMPANVKDFNSDVDWQNSLRGKIHFRRVTVEEVSRKLGKTLHVRNTGEKTDHIEYKSNVYDTETIGWVTFKYDIYRDDNDGHLTIKYWHNFSSYAFMVDLSKPEKLKESQEEKSDGSISKQEEFQALEFIKRKVIPFAVSLYQTGVDRRLQITNIIKQLQKIKHEKQGESKRSKLIDSDYIEYKSMIGDKPMVFIMMKRKSKEYPEDDEYTRVFTAGFYGLLDHSPLQFKRPYLWPVNSDNKTQLTLKESTELGIINRMEEQEAFNFIKKVVVPKILSIYNDKNQRKDSLDRYNRYEPITAQDVNKHLVKRRHVKSDKHRFGHSDMIEYMAIMPAKGKPGAGPVFEFQVFKDAEGTFVSYTHPFKMENWIMRVGCNY